MKRVDLRVLKDILRDANDARLREVVAIIDQAEVPAINQTLLDPIRRRVATLAPQRKISFGRLLFMPLDPLIVPAQGWKPEHPAVPRTILLTFSRLIRVLIPEAVRPVDRVIAGRHMHDADVLEEAGAILWPAAAAALASAEIPADWVEATGLPVTVFAPQSRAIAAVLRRAETFRRLARDAEVGILTPDKAGIAEVLHGIESETSLTRGMIVQTLLLTVPAAAPLIRFFARDIEDRDTRAAIVRSLGTGIEALLGTLELRGIATGNGPADLTQEVTMRESLFQDLENDPLTSRHRPRLSLIRARLDDVCQTQIADGIRTRLDAPLSAPDQPMTACVVEGLEANARDLRGLETVARKFGSKSAYDALTDCAASTVTRAAAAGRLTPIQHMRLIEIIRGPEAAEDLYRSWVRWEPVSAAAAAEVAAERREGPHQGSSA